jgi:hypothetical protein
MGIGMAFPQKDQNPAKPGTKLAPKKGYNF